MENVIDKKLKVTHYFSKQENDMLLQLYSTAMMEGKKKDKSEIVGQAVQLFFREELGKLERLSKEKHEELNNVTDQIKPYIPMVPLAKGPALTLQFDEALKMMELVRKRTSLEEEVRNIDYLIYQFKKLIVTEENN